MPRRIGTKKLFRISEMMDQVNSVCKDLGKTISKQNVNFDSDGFLMGMQKLIIQHGNGSSYEEATASSQDAKPQYNLAADVICLAYSRMLSGDKDAALQVLDIAMQHDSMESLAKSLNELNAASDLGEDKDDEDVPEDLMDDEKDSDEEDDEDEGNVTDTDSMEETLDVDPSDEEFFNEELPEDEEDDDDDDDEDFYEEEDSALTASADDKAKAELKAKSKVVASDTKALDNKIDQLILNRRINKSQSLKTQAEDEESDDEEKESKLHKKFREARERKAKASVNSEMMALARKVSITGQANRLRVAREIVNK